MLRVESGKENLLTISKIFSAVIMYSSKLESIIVIRKLFYLVSFISKLKIAHEWMDVITICIIEIN